MTAQRARPIHKCHTDRVFLPPDPLHIMAGRDTAPFTAAPKKHAGGSGAPITAYNVTSRQRPSERLPNVS